jgi:hypothetical protein
MKIYMEIYVHNKGMYIGILLFQCMFYFLH